jgi:hypothetical protein
MRTLSKSQPLSNLKFTLKTNIFVAILLAITTFGFAQCPSGIIILANQSEVDNFSSAYPSCTELQGSLFVGVAGGAQTITNLNGLSQITSIGFVGSSSGTLNLSGLTNLQSLEGLNSLEYVKGITIIASSISNFEGLDSLSIIDGSLVVESNPDLVNLEGLSTLTNLEGFFQFIDNASLLNFEGLSSAVSGINGFPGDIVISVNPILTSLEGMQGLQEIRNFSVNGNSVLNSIDAVANLQQINATVINIIDNPNLPNCSIQFVCDSFDNSGISRFISNNQTGCNTEAEVEAGCLLSSNDFDLDDEIVIFPNPVTKDLEIVTSNGIMVKEISLISARGINVLSETSSTLDLAGLASGVYFLQIDTDQGRVIKKILKR